MILDTATRKSLLQADFVETLETAVEMEVAAGIILGPFHKDWLLRNRAPATVKENLRLGRERAYLQMARQGFQSMDTNDGNPADFSPRNTSASELMILQDAAGTASGTCSQATINEFCAISANDPRAGKVYGVRAAGVYSNTATPTILWTPRWGSSPTVATNVTLGAQPSAWTTITGTSGLQWFAQFDFTIRTLGIGATQGTGKGNGFVMMGIPVTSSVMAAGLMFGGTGATIDTTGQGAAGLGLTLNITWGTSSASNTLTTTHWLLSSRN